MSQANVEIVKANIDAYNREDWDAFFKDAAPGFELDFSRAFGPWRGVFGPDQARRVVLEMREALESARVEPHEFIEAGDLVVMPWTIHGRGRDGIELAARFTMAFAIRNGAVERVTMYQERQDALEDLGLSEQPTSQENLELVRSIFAGWERGDFSSADWAHPQIEYAAVGDTPTAGSAKGLAEMARRWRVFLRTWEEFRAEAEEYRDLDDERVLVLAHMGGRGKASGLDLGQMRTKGAILFHVHDAKVTRLVIYNDRERAFADLGLSE